VRNHSWGIWKYTRSCELFHWLLRSVQQSRCICGLFLDLNSTKFHIYVPSLAVLVACHHKESCVKLKWFISYCHRVRKISAVTLFYLFPKINHFNKRCTYIFQRFLTNSALSHYSEWCCCSHTHFITSHLERLAGVAEDRKLKDKKGLAFSGMIFTLSFVKISKFGVITLF
jgi:hypothetical protein